ncbi:MAG TPA: TPM domain-containing protein [Nostocaceae cyanobacterium]|nr:TPM domain-containing protein [Nostocaceae cyanobacterium]
MQQILKQLFNFPKYASRLILPLVMVIMTAVLFVPSALATGVYDIPSLTADTWVLDQGDVISRSNEGQISNTFKDLAQKTGKEVRFVTIRRLDYGETPESFAKGLFTKWFPTAEAQANQTLLVIDTVTNGMAVISGDGAKSLLSDDITNSVVEETIGTSLRNGNKYNQAFLAASDRLNAVLSGQPDPGPPQITEIVQVESTFKTSEETEKDRGNATFWVVGLLIAATIIPMATYYIYQINQPSGGS